jgi:hypothetical protein
MYRIMVTTQQHKKPLSETSGAAKRQPFARGPFRRLTLGTKPFTWNGFAKTATLKNLPHPEFG